MLCNIPFTGRNIDVLVQIAIYNIITTSLKILYQGVYYDYVAIFKSFMQTSAYYTLWLLRFHPGLVVSTVITTEIVCYDRTFTIVRFLALL